MERGTEEIFEELTRGLEDEMTERRRRELLLYRRGVPRILVVACLGALSSTVTGLLHPLFGATVFLATVVLLERSVAKLSGRR